LIIEDGKNRLSQKVGNEPPKKKKTLRNIPEQRKYHVRGGGGLKSRIFQIS